jgi:hypothetical protein
MAIRTLFALLLLTLAVACQSSDNKVERVMTYRTMYLQAIDTKSKSYSGGFGKWLHLGTSSPKDTDIVSPNNDTPYSYAWVDLRSEPWVLTLPKIEVLNGQYEIPGLVKGKQ